MDNKIDKNEKDTNIKHKKKEKLMSTYDKNKSVIDPIHKTSNDIAIETKVPSTSSIELLSKNESTPPKSRRKSRSTSRHNNSPTDDKKPHFLNEGKQYNEKEKKQLKSSSIKLKTASSSVLNESEPKTSFSDLKLSPNKHKKDVVTTEDLVKEHTKNKRKTRTLYDINRDVPKADHTNEKRDEEMKGVATDKVKELRKISEGQPNKVAYVKLDRYEPEHRSDEELKKTTRKLKRKRSNSDNRERKTTIEKGAIKKKEVEVHDSKIPRGESKSQGKVNSRKHKKKSKAELEISDKNTERRKHKSHDRKSYKNVSSNLSSDHANITNLQKNLPLDETLSSTLRKNKDDPLCTSGTNNLFNENKQDCDGHLVTELKDSGSESCRNEVEENISKSNYEITSDEGVLIASNTNNGKLSPNENGSEFTCLGDDKLVKGNTSVKIASNVEISPEKAFDVTVIPSIRNEVDSKPTVEQINTHVDSDFIAEKNTLEKLDIKESEKIIHCRKDVIENETKRSSITSVNEQIFVNVLENAGVKKVASNEEKCSQSTLDSKLPIEPVIIKETDPQPETFITDNIKISNANRDIEERKLENIEDMEANAKEENLKNYEKFAQSKLDSKLLIEPEVLKETDPLPDTFITDNIETSNDNRYINEIKHKNIKDVETNTKEENLKNYEKCAQSKLDSELLIEPEVLKQTDPLPDTFITDNIETSNRYIKEIKHKNIEDVETNTKEENLKIVEIEEHNNIGDKIICDPSKPNTDRPTPQVCDLESPLSPDPDSHIDGYSEEENNLRSNKQKHPSEEFSGGAMFDDLVVKFNSELPNTEPEKNQDVSKLVANFDEGAKGDGNISFICRNEIKEPKIHIDYEQGVSHAKLEDINRDSCIYDENIEYDESQNNEIEVEPQQSSKVVTDVFDEKMITQNLQISKLDVQCNEENTKHAAQKSSQVMSMNTEEEADICYESEKHFDNANERGDVSSDQIPVIKSNDPPTATNVFEDQDRCLKLESFIVSESEKEMEYSSKIPEETVEDIDENQFIPVDVSSNECDGEVSSETEGSPYQKFKAESCSDKIEEVNSKNTIEETDIAINEHGFNQATDKVLQEENEHHSLHLEVLTPSDENPVANLENTRQISKITDNTKDVGQIPSQHLEISAENEINQSSGAELESEQAQNDSKLSNDDIGSNLTVHQNVLNEVEIFTSHEREPLESQTEIQLSEVIYNIPEEDATAHQDKNADHNVSTTSDNDNSEQVPCSERSQVNFQDDEVADQNEVLDMKKPYNTEPEPKEADRTGRITQLETEAEKTDQILHLETGFPKINSIEVELKVQSSGLPGKDLVSSPQSEIYQDVNNVVISHVEYQPEILEAATGPMHNLEIIETSETTETEIIIEPRDDPPSSKIKDSGNGYDTDNKNSNSDLLPVCKEMEPKVSELNTKLDLLNSPRKINVENTNCAKIVEYEVQVAKVFFSNDEEEAESGSIANHDSQLRSEGEEEEIIPPPAYKNSEIPKDIDVEEEINENYQINSEVKEIPSNLKLNYVINAKEESPKSKRKREDELYDIKESVLIKRSNMEIENTIFSSQEVVDKNIVMNTIEVHSEESRITFEEHMDQERISNEDVLGSEQNKLETSKSENIQFEQHISGNIPTEIQNKFENHDETHNQQYLQQSKIENATRLNTGNVVDEANDLISDGEKRYIYEHNTVSKEQEPKSTKSTDQTQQHHLEDSPPKLSFSIERMLKPSYQIEQNPPVENTVGIVEPTASTSNLEIKEVTCFKRPEDIITNLKYNTKKKQRKKNEIVREQPDPPFENRKVVVERVYSMDELAVGIDINPCLNLCSAPFVPISNECIPYRYGVYGTVIPTLGRNDSHLQSTVPNTLNESASISNVETHNSLPKRERKRRMSSKKESSEDKTVEPRNIHSTTKPENDVEFVEIDINQKMKSENNKTEYENEISQEIDSNIHQNEMRNSLIASKNAEIVDKKANFYSPSNNVQNNQPNINETNLQQTFSCEISASDNVAKSNTDESTTSLLVSKEEKIDNLQFDSVTPSGVFNKGDQSKTLGTNQLNLNSTVKSNDPDQTFLPSLNRQLIPESEEIELTYNMGHVPGNELNTMVGTHDGPQTMSNSIETSKEILSHNEVSPIYNSSLEPLSDSFGDKVIDGSSASEGMESLLNSFQSAISDSMTHSLPSIQESFSMFSNNSNTDMQFSQDNQVSSVGILQVDFQDKSTLPSNQSEDFSNEKLNLVQSTPMRLEEAQQPHDSIFSISDIFGFDLSAVNQASTDGTFSDYVNTIFENLLYNLNNVGCEVTVDNTNAEDGNGNGGLTQEQLIDSIPSYIAEEFDSTDPMVGGQKELVSDPKQDSNLDEAPFPESALSFDEEMMHRYASLLDCEDPSPQQSNSDEPSQIGNSRETSEPIVLQELTGKQQIPESAIEKIDGSNVENINSTEVLAPSLSLAQEVSILDSDDISCMSVEAKGRSTLGCNSTVNEPGGHALLQNQEIESFNKTSNISETYPMTGDQMKLIPDSKQDYNLVKTPFQDSALVVDAKTMHRYASIVTEQDSNPKQHQGTKKPINKATRISRTVIADKPEVEKKSNRKSSARVQKIPASKYAPPKKLQSNETMICKKQPEKVPIKQPNNSNTEKQVKPLIVDTGVKHSLDMPQLLSPTENTFWGKKTLPSSYIDKNESKSNEPEDHLNEVNETPENVTESDFIHHTQYNMYDRTKAMKRNAAKIENYSKFYDDDASSLNKSKKQKIVTKPDKTEDHLSRDKRSSTLQQDNLERDESTRSKRFKSNELFPDTNSESAAYRYEPPSRDSLHVNLDDEFDRLKKSGPFKSSASKSSKGTRIDRILRNAQEEHHQIPTISSQYKHGDRGRRVDSREYVDNYRRTEDYKRRTKGEERSRSPHSRSRTHVSISGDHRRESSKRSTQEMTRSDSSYSRECQSSLEDRRRTPLEGHHPNDFHKKAERSQKKNSPRYHQHLFSRPHSSQAKKKPYDYGGKEWYEQLNEKFPLDKDVYHNKGH